MTIFIDRNSLKGPLEWIEVIGRELGHFGLDWATLLLNSETKNQDNRSYDRVYRAILSRLVPPGPYCYWPKGVVWTKNGSVMRIKCCPFWQSIGPKGGPTVARNRDESRFFSVIV